MQISFQDVDEENAERISAYPKGLTKKLEVAGWVSELGLPLTINAPIHRHNILNVGRYIELAVSSAPSGSKSPMLNITAGPISIARGADSDL